MKQILTFLAFLIFYNSSAQDLKPPQLTIAKGFLSDQYQIGNKEANPKQVRLHLKKYSSEAYYQWRKAENATIAGTVLAIAGAAGVLIGAVSGEDNPGLAAGGYLAGAVCWSGTLVFSLTSAKGRARAFRTYNKQYGY